MSFPLRCVAGLSLALLLAACATTPDTVAPTPSKPRAASPDWLTDVTVMSSREANGGRREYLQQRLEGIGLQPREQAFSSGELNGSNLLVDVSGPADAPLLLLGAHFDRVDAGQGATDNASGSAVVLALAERFARKPLQRHRLAVAFWDLEERGLLGARAFVAEPSAHPALYVNFDVFGWGDSLWMMSRDAEHPLVIASREAGAAQGLALSAGDQYPPTDHQAFLAAGVPAVSYSLVDAVEIAGILDIFAGKPPALAPKVMQVIHSERDTVEHVDAADVARGIDAVEAALRRWDAQAD
ncbi:MAG TPA: M28 family peptidase [Arenimonas sp.]|nr:M28 family peptidase [Arenimonas sp.]